MIDYLLKFPSQAVAEQFGIANGYVVNNEGVIETTLATHEYALHEIGEHNGDGQYWVLFRDLIGIPIPEGGEVFIHWFSASDEPRPIDDPATPTNFWA